MRSKASSSTSTSSNKKSKLKKCCRAFVELMFTQVGVGGLVVAYTLMGASIFQYIETQVSSLPHPQKLSHDLSLSRSRTPR